MKLLPTIIIILFALHSNGQDSQLFENDWYLEKLIINGQDNFPPSNSEVEFVSAIFDKPNSLITSVCNSLDTELEFSNPDEFKILTYSLTLIICNLQVNSDFEGIYFNFFFNQATQEPYTEPFPYDIIVNGSGMTLTITNVNGDIAFYGNDFLSNQDFDAPSFNIYPNPLKEELFISTIKDLTDFNVNIFSINGNAVLPIDSFDTNNESIDVSILESGIYFILLKDNQGRTSTKKFIKE